MAAALRDRQPWLDPTTEPHIQIERVLKRYGDMHAVDDVSLDIHQGELFALLGGSGCGKTTLLRMLAGFVEPDQGRIRIGGVDVLGQPPYERPVNMMFQSYALFPHMSVADNIAFGLRRDGIARPEIDRRVAEMLELVQMAPLARRKPQQLSGGQRQRVALARAIVKRPKVLLLDEPLSALDKKLREATQFELIRIQEQVGITFVMVTHDQEEAMTMASRIAVMDKGRIIQVGPPQEIYEAPKNRFVAEFIGSVNLFDGQLAANATELVVPGLDAPLRLAGGNGLVPGRQLSIGVRPEKLRMVKAGAGFDAVNQIPGRIQDRAYLGDSCLYQVAIAGDKILKVTAPNLGRWADQPFSRDDSVLVGWSPDAAITVEP